MARGTGYSADTRLYSTFRGQQMNDHVNPVFCDILAAVAPPEGLPMHEAKSRQLIEEVAQILCSTPTQRIMLQNIYSMGRADGLIEAAHKTLEKIRA